MYRIGTNSGDGTWTWGSPVGPKSTHVTCSRNLGISKLPIRMYMLNWDTLSVMVAVSGSKLHSPNFQREMYILRPRDMCTRFREGCAFNPRLSVKDK